MLGSDASIFVYVFSELDLQVSLSWTQIVSLNIVDGRVKQIILRLADYVEDQKPVLVDSGMFSFAPQWSHTV